MAASKFDYASMFAVQSELKSKGTDISKFVNDIADKATTGVNSCYTGAAADAYVSAFKKVATEVSAALDEIVTKLHQELEQQQADYTAKEQQMSDSVSIPTLGN